MIRTEIKNAFDIKFLGKKIKISGWVRFKRQSKNPEGYVSKRNDHNYGLKPVKGFENKGTRYPKSILNISRDFSAQQQLHPTQKPVPLLEWLIKTFSNEGEIVLDNCMGSGSTGVAAMNLNRRFIGMETEQKYFDIAKQRIEVGRLPVQ